MKGAGLDINNNLALAIRSQRAVMYINSNRSRPTMIVKRTPAKMTIERTPPSFSVKKQRAPIVSKNIINRNSGKPYVFYDNKSARAPRSINYIVNNFHFGNYSHNTSSHINIVANNYIPSYADKYGSYNSYDMYDNHVLYDNKDLLNMLSELEWNEGSFDVIWSPATLDIEWDMHGELGPDIHVDPYKLEIFLRSRGRFNARIKEDHNIDFAHKIVGKKVDRKA